MTNEVKLSERAIFLNGIDMLNILKDRMNQQLEDNGKVNEDDFWEYYDIIMAALRSRSDSYFINFSALMTKSIKYNLPAAAAVSMRVNKVFLYFNPIILLKLSHTEIMAVIIHEIYHIICLHLVRDRQARRVHPHEIINISMDIAINQFIEDLPEWVCTIDSVLVNQYGYDRSDVEDFREFEYYLQLIVKSKKYQQDKEKMEEKTRELRQKLRDLLEEYSDKNGDGQDTGDGGDGQGNADGGDGNDSGGDGNGLADKLKDLVEEAAKHGIDLFGDHTWHTEEDDGTDEQAMSDFVRDMIRNAGSMTRGLIPGNVQQFLDQLNTKSEIPWQTFLRNRLGSVKVPYKRTPLRPDRRQPHRRDIRGRISDRELNILIGIDTSGSQSDEQIQFALNEIYHITKNVKSSVTVIECDSRVGRIYDIKAKRDIKNNVTGRGGTLFSPVIEEGNKMSKRKRVDLMVYFTDGGGESELSQKPKYPMLWIVKERGEYMSLPEGKRFGPVKFLDFDRG